MERLDAKPIAGAEGLAAGLVPTNEGEHADQAVEASIAPFEVRGQEDLGIGLGAERVVSDQFCAKLQVVVDLTVENDPIAAGYIAHRMAASGRKVNDTQPIVAQPRHT